MNFQIDSLPPNPRILLIRFRSIGDVTLNTAVLPLIKENLPDCKLDYLVMAPNDQIIRNNPHVDEVIAIQRTNKKNETWDTFQLIRRLRKTSYDMVIDMHGGPRSALITLLSKARYKVGLKGSRRARFYNVKVNPVFNRSVLTGEFQARMLELLGMKVERQAPKIYVTEEELKQISGKLEEAGVDTQKKYGVIHPGVDFMHNWWEPEKFAEVADVLQNRYDCQVVFASSPSQVWQVDKILACMKTPTFSLAGRTSLRELAALMQKGEFLFCHNSGPMHMGAAVGTPVFAIFGPISPHTWAPQVEPHHVFYKDLDCSPCTRASRKAECNEGKPECKQLITAQEAIEAIEEKMGWKNRA